MGSRMRKLFTVGSSLALAVAVFLGMTPRAEAGAFFQKKVSLQVVRNSTGADNPFVAAGGTVNVSTPICRYKLGYSNGYHGGNTIGNSAVLVDTSDAIDIRDHWLRQISLYRSPLTLGTTTPQAVSDSAVFGTLQFTAFGSCAAVADTVIFFRDVSVDGITWTALDSIGGHVVSNIAQIVTGAVSDSAEFVLGSVSNASGVALRQGGFSFYVSPWQNTSNVTAQAFIGVNFIRFRWHMTAGDFAVAGNTGGWNVDFTYPASDIEPIRTQPTVAQQPL